MLVDRCVVDESFGLGLAVLFVVDETTVIPLIKEQFLIYFAHLFAWNMLWVFGIALRKVVSADVFFEIE